MNKIILTSFWSALALVWVVIGLFYYQGSRPASDDLQSQIFEIQPGMTLKKVSTELGNIGIIRSPSVFQIIAYIQSKQKQVMAGEYDLSPSMLPSEILLRITSGKTVLHPITIPEGYRINEIATILSSKGLADEETFINETQDKNLIQSLGTDAENLEGYLFPETYYFSKFTQEKKIVQKMVATFKERVLTPQFLKNARESHLSLHEIVTLASLIEKETGLSSERKRISSVFHNRLRKNMRLQTDPTVIYAIEKFDGNIRKRDLKIDSLYNTYRYKGLPPGPIASPGLQSIIAAISPIKSQYLYFVSRKDGSHQFSSTLNEHNRAVQKYQLKRTRYKK